MPKTKKDYFKLPFEVYYSEYIPITQNEFKSDIEIKKFSDIKIVHQEQGLCWGAKFKCDKNNGPELYCCIANEHDEVHPSWLEFLEEDNAEFNSGVNFAIQKKKNEVKFRDLTDDECDEASDSYLDVYSMDYCCSDGLFAYHLDQSAPEYLILDSEDSRIKVDLEGFVLDENEMPTAKRIFNPEKLDPEAYSDYSSRDFYDLRVEWISNIFANDFPNEKPLKYSGW